MDKGAWWATVFGVAKSLTWLSNWAHTHVDSGTDYLYAEGRGMRGSLYFLFKFDVNLKLL